MAGPTDSGTNDAAVLAVAGMGLIIILSLVVFARKRE